MGYPLENNEEIAQVCPPLQALEARCMPSSGCLARRQEQKQIRETFWSQLISLVDCGFSHLVKVLPVENQNKENTQDLASSIKYGAK